MKDNKAVEFITHVANGSKSLLSYIVICIQYSIVFTFRFQRFKENLYLELGFWLVWSTREQQVELKQGHLLHIIIHLEGIFI